MALGQRAAEVRSMGVLQGERVVLMGLVAA